MQKITSLFITVCLTLLMCVCAHAAAGEISVYLKGYSGVDGEKISFDILPQNVNGRTMVPIRAIFEAMGATVDWDDTTQPAICTKDSTVVKMTLNSTTEYINDVPVTMDVTPVIISGRTLAPRTLCRGSLRVQCQMGRDDAACAYKHGYELQLRRRR